MAPKYERGDLILIDARKPNLGDYVLVEIRPKNSTVAGDMVLGCLTHKTDRRLTCYQYNPVAAVELDRSEVKAVWRVLPPREFLAFSQLWSLESWA
jgi:hypothetical protein